MGAHFVKVQSIRSFESSETFLPPSSPGSRLSVQMELGRKFRVLDQTLSMHTMLRDHYARRALLVDGLLLACSVVFCASAFASDQVLALLGGSPDRVRYLLKAFSVVTFMLSVLSLRVDWKGIAAAHRQAGEKMSGALAVFRKYRRDDGFWDASVAGELDSIYWEAMRNCVSIPESAFLKLKARHLRKVEISKMLDSNPGCPISILSTILFLSSLRKTKRTAKHMVEKQ